MCVVQVGGLIKEKLGIQCAADSSTLEVGIDVRASSCDPLTVDVW